MPSFFCATTTVVASSRDNICVRIIGKRDLEVGGLLVGRMEIGSDRCERAVRRNNGCEMRGPMGCGSRLQNGALGEARAERGRSSYVPLVTTGAA